MEINAEEEQEAQDRARPVWQRDWVGLCARETGWNSVAGDGLGEKVTF